MGPKLIEVSPLEDMHQQVLDQLRHSMPDAYISALWRVENKQLLALYDSHKHRFTMQRAPHNETRVWHGTRVDPAIICTQDFMVEKSRGGSWGHGIYFAQESLTSDFYAFKPRYHNVSRGVAEYYEKELILTILLVGKAIHLANGNHQLRKPPVSEDGTPSDTVTGKCSGLQVFVVYENGRAYPEYLVRYYRASERNRFCWEFNDYPVSSSKVKWLPFSPAHQEDLEKAFQTGLTAINLQTNAHKYLVDLKAWVQTNTSHQNHTQRKIQRRIQP